MVVYIREAHAADSDWPEPLATQQNITTPTTYDERRALANRCVTKLDLDIPCVIDDMDNSVDKSYDGYPDRIFLVDSEGSIVVRGDRGPWGFKPGVTAVTAWLAEQFPEAKSRVGTQ